MTSNKQILAPLEASNFDDIVRPAFNAIELILDTLFPKTPLALFIEKALNSKIQENPALQELESQILESIFSHTNFIERDKIREKPNQYEKQHFITLLERIIGGCVTQAPFLPTINKAKEFAKSIYAQKCMSDIQIGTVIKVLQKGCPDSFFGGIAKLSHNTLRKIIKEFAPKAALRKGRSKPADIGIVQQVIESEFGSVAFLI